MKRSLSFTSFLLLILLAASAQTWNLKAPFARAPALLTSVGQSADIEMVRVLMNRSGLQFKADATIAAADLGATGAKTLILAIGGSSKGLGAAGISADAELARSKALIVEAKRLGMKIIGVHVGGEARRGELSDKFIVAAIPACDYVIIVEAGDKDGLFTKLCGTGIPLDKVEKISKAGVPLAAAFVK